MFNVHSNKIVLFSTTNAIRYTYYLSLSLLLSSGQSSLFYLSADDSEAFHRVNVIFKITVIKNFFWKCIKNLKAKSQPPAKLIIVARYIKVTSVRWYIYVYIDSIKIIFIQYKCLQVCSFFSISLLFPSLLLYFSLPLYFFEFSLSAHIHTSSTKKNSFKI